MSAVKYDAFDDYKFNERWRYDPLPSDKSRKGECRDIFSSLFKKRWEFTGEESRVKEFIQDLKITEEYRHLRAATVLSDGAAYEASRVLFTKFIQDNPKLEPDQEAQEDRSPEAQRERRRSARRVMRQASDAADTYSEIEEILGLSSGDGCGNRGEGEESKADIMSLMRKLIDSRELRDLMKMAGRMVNLATSALATETTRGVDKLIGIETGDDLRKILPGELWSLMVEDYFLLRYSEKSLGQYAYAGKETKGHGPVILLVDKSGSMSGQRFDYAKALVIGAAHLAAARNRKLSVVMFNGAVEGEKSFAPGDVTGVVKWVISQRASGRTNFDAPLRRALKLQDGSEWKDADIVLLTDGRSKVSESTAEVLKLRQEQEGLKFFVVYVAPLSNPAVDTLANYVTTVDMLQASAGNESETLQIFKNIVR